MVNNNNNDDGEDDDPIDDWASSDLTSINNNNNSEAAKNKCRLIDAFMGKEYCALAWAFYITDNKNK